MGGRGKSSPKIKNWGWEFVWLFGLGATAVGSERKIAI